MGSNVSCMMNRRQYASLCVTLDDIRVIVKKNYQCSIDKKDLADEHARNQRDEIVRAQTKSRAAAPSPW